MFKTYNNNIIQHLHKLSTKCNKIKNTDERLRTWLSFEIVTSYSLQDILLISNR